MSYNNRTVAENLRAKNKVLKDKIDAVIGACNQVDTIDVSHKADELAKLPRRILKILGAEE